MIWFKLAAGPGPNYLETAVFAFCRKVENWPKIRFSVYKHPPNGSSLLIIWEKDTFFPMTNFPGRGRDRVRVKKCMFFWPKIFGFRPEYLFFDMGPRFSSLDRF